MTIFSCFPLVADTVMPTKYEFPAKAELVLMRPHPKALATVLNTGLAVTMLGSAWGAVSL